MTPCSPLRILAVEPSFPGKLGAVAAALATRRGCRITHLHHQRRDPQGTDSVLSLLGYPVGGVARETAVAWPRLLERGFCYAYAAFETLRDRPIEPIDLILGHSQGLGSTLFLSTLYPRVPILQRVDPFLHPRLYDLADDDAPSQPLEYALWRRTANTMSLLDLENGVVPWATSAWVRDTYPTEYRASIQVHPEGVDFARVTTPAAPFSIAGRSLTLDTRLVTFAARSADRLRGIDHFVWLARQLIDARPNVVCAIVGEPRVERGLDVRDLGTSPLDGLLVAHGLESNDRVWKLGVLPRETLEALIARSSLVVVPGRMAEPTRVVGQAMAASRVVLGFDIPPMREWIESNRTGLLVPGDDLDALTTAAVGVLDDPAAHGPLGKQAADWIRAERERGDCLDRLMASIPSLPSS